MRRSIATMLVTWGALSTSLAAQAQPEKASNAIGFGFAATLGNGWQIEGAEVAYVKRRPTGFFRAYSAGARIGTFIDEGAILGGSRGIVFAPTLGARTAPATIAELGDELNPTAIGFTVTFEASGYVASSSPIAYGSSWGALAVLPGLGAGGGNSMRFSLVVGPTLFIGKGKSNVRGLFALRFEAPLARRERAP